MPPALLGSWKGQPESGAEDFCLRSLLVGKGSKSSVETLPFLQARYKETVRSSYLPDSALLQACSSLEDLRGGHGSHRQRPAGCWSLKSLCSHHPSLPPPINYIHQHIYLACNMENSYSYLGFSGLTLINVRRAMAPRGAPPDESWPIKFQSSL